jgi:hypothetical protein
LIPLNFSRWPKAVTIENDETSVQRLCSHSAATVQLQCSDSAATVQRQCSDSAATVQQQGSAAETVQRQFSESAAAVQRQLKIVPSEAASEKLPRRFISSAARFSKARR